MEIIMFAKPGNGWGLSIAPNCPNDDFLHWADPDLISLCGFTTAFDAWAFAIAHLMIDPSAGLPNRWTLKPESMKTQQLDLFSWQPNRA